MATTVLPDAQRTAVETFISDWLTEQRIPGAAVAIVDEDNLVYAEGFGARRLENNAQATPNTLFGIASCTKPFTATTVMQLVERGDLALQDPVNDYLPYLSCVPGDPVTVEELLSHTSGMPSDGLAGPLIARRLGIGPVEVPLSSEADFRRHVQGAADRRITDSEEFFYYNSGYTMLGRVVEEVTGQPFSDRVEEHVLRPLGMNRSTFDRDAFEAEADRMTPYLKQEDTSVESAFPFDPLMQPSGGLLSSARELAAFVQMYLGNGSVDDRSVLSSGSIDTMTTPRGTVGTYFDGREVGYGCGFMLEPFLGDQLIGHGGSVGVSSAWLGYLEDAGLGLALACTTTPEIQPTSAGQAILALLQGKEPAAVVPHYRLLAALETVTGEYNGYRNTDTTTVVRIGGGLKLECKNSIDPDRLLTPICIEEDRLVCRTVMTSGIEREARFDVSGDQVELFFQNTRFRKSG